MPSQNSRSPKNPEINPIKDAEFALIKERQKQQMNGLEVAIGDEKLKQKHLSLAGEKVRTEISEIALDTVLESKFQAENNLKVAKEKTQQSADNLRLESGRTKINAEKCLLEAEKIAFELSQAQLQLSESKAHFKLFSGNS